MVTSIDIIAPLIYFSGAIDFFVNICYNLFDILPKLGSDFVYYGCIKIGGMKMSSPKKHYKRFSIESVHDACSVLGMLISNVTINLEKYEDYASEALDLLEKADAEYIDAKQYDAINDKL